MARTLVIGATRGTGRLVVETLLARGDTVRVAARDLAKARRLFGARVELEEVELTRPGPALDRALAGVDGVVFTAGVPPGFASSALLEATEHAGVVATVDAARRVGFTGRFVYLTTMGLHRPSFAIGLLGLVKRNVVHWRRAAERALAASSLQVVIVRAGLLIDGPAAQRQLDLAAGDRPVSFSTRVSRADVARVLVAALDATRPCQDLSVFSGSGPAPDQVELGRLVSV